MTLHLFKCCLYCASIVKLYIFKIALSVVTLLWRNLATPMMRMNITSDVMWMGCDTIMRKHQTNPFPGGSGSKEYACNAGHLGSISALGRSPREGNGYPLQYSCLENSVNIGAWQATVHGVTKSQTRLND